MNDCKSKGIWLGELFLGVWYYPKFGRFGRWEFSYNGWRLGDDVFSVSVCMWRFQFSATHWWMPFRRNID
jgi:hypothetical protein